MRDTDDQTDEFYFSLIAKLTPFERLEKAANLSQALRDMTKQHLALRYPEATAKELGKHFVRQVYGEEFVAWLE